MFRLEVVIRKKVGRLLLCQQEREIRFLFYMCYYLFE